MRVGLNLNKGHDLSTKYLCESGNICVCRFVVDGRVDLGRPSANFVKQVISVGTWLGERGDVVDHLARPNGDFQHQIVFLANQGKYDDAEPLYKRALTIREETLGPRHPDVAQSLNNLAGLLKSQVMWH